MDKIMEVSTDNNPEYQFYPVSSGSVQFKVRAANDAHIALTTGPQESDPMIEIFIGGLDSKNVIRRNRTEMVETETPGILNDGEYRGFWVEWDSGVVTAGREGQGIPFISWTDPEPFPIGFVGVCTGCGATGTWKIEGGDGPEFNTPDQLEYVFGPVASGSLEFEYRGSHNCHVCLTSAPVEAEPIYEIILGDWENTESVIRHNKQTPDKVTVPPSQLMSPDEFKKFVVEWRCGKVTVHDKASDAVIMEWTDPMPFPVSHFGVRTASGGHGNWRIKHFPSAGGAATQ